MYQLSDEHLYNYKYLEIGCSFDAATTDPIVHIGGQQVRIATIAQMYR